MFSTTTVQKGDGELVWPLQVNILLYSAVSYRVLQDFALTADITAVTTVLSAEMHLGLYRIPCSVSNYNLIYDPLSNQLA